MPNTFAFVCRLQLEYDFGDLVVLCTLLFSPHCVALASSQSVSGKLAPPSELLFALV